MSLTPTDRRRVEELLSRSAALVDRELEHRLASAGFHAAVGEAVLYSLRAGGKRLRPMLAILSAEVCGLPMMPVDKAMSAAGPIPPANLPPGDSPARQARSEAVMAVAAALEMIHTYSLIHDDLPAMDNDDLRRGKPTNHKVFGEAMAILAGDALLTEAFAVLAEGVGPLDADLAVRLVGELATAAGGAGMIGGQAADILAERGRWNRPDTGFAEDALDPVAARTTPTARATPAAGGVFPHGVIDEPSSAAVSGTPQVRLLGAIHRHKTARLIRSALRMGAMTAGATTPQREALSAYGESLGLAFQVVDDILDETATGAEQLGKSPGKDRATGKLTYPGLLGLQAAADIAQRLTQQALGCLELFGPAAGDLALVARYNYFRKT